MGFNYGLEKKRFDSEWKKIAAWYKAEGMSDEAIASMHKFDWAVFCAERGFVNHTQQMPDEFFDDETECSTLYQKFESLSTRITEDDLTGRFDWIQTIDDEVIATKLLAMSDDDIELLTLIVIDGYAQKEIAAAQGCAQSNIAQKIARIKKLLK